MQNVEKLVRLYASIRFVEQHTEIPFPAFAGSGLEITQTQSFEGKRRSVRMTFLPLFFDAFHFPAEAILRIGAVPGGVRFVGSCRRRVRGGVFGPRQRGEGEEGEEEGEAFHRG
jgi:hypothetical protein